MHCWKNMTLSSKQSTLTPPSTLQTAPPEASFPQHTFSSPTSNFPMKSNLSLLISTPQITSAKKLLLNALLQQRKRPYPPPNTLDDNESPSTKKISRTSPKRSRLLEAIAKSNAAATQDNFPDDPSLPFLKPSPLRPKCPASERIRKWKPENPRNILDGQGLPTNLNDNDLARIGEVLEEAYAPNTRSTYGTGLFAFHEFCDYKEIEEKHRAPVDKKVLASFIATYIGTYGGGTIRNFVYGIRAWHVIHGVPWEVNHNELKALLTAGKRLAPPESKAPAKEPWTLDYLTIICQNLDPNEPRDAAIHACLTTAFWGTARLAEVTVPTLDGFDPRMHVKPSDVQLDTKDINGLKMTNINLPWSKAAHEKGEAIYWAEQEGITDPKAALMNHLKINKPPNNGHLFSFKHQKTLRPMTKHAIDSALKDILAAHNLPKIPYHGIRVGSTIVYLLRGISFDVVKAKGRWQSDAFKLYLRQHAQIMAPYMQANPKLFDGLVRYSMPPVR